MRSGQLNNRVEIQHQVQTTDAVGATQYDWATLCYVWANIRHVSGAEMIKADQVSETVKASIRIRFNNAITSGMRVIFQDQVYDIQAILPDYAKYIYTDLVCIKIGEKP